jgi:hypothetical protein
MTELDIFQLRDKDKNTQNLRKFTIFYPEVRIFGLNYTGITANLI